MSWPAAGIFRSVADSEALVPPKEYMQPIPVVKLHAGEGLPVSSFHQVHPQSDDVWASTPEGEWAANVKEHDTSLWSLLRLNTGGACALASVAIYRPNSNDLTLRLNFQRCSGPRGGPHHASIEVSLNHSSTGEGSGIIDWMCALMPHKACRGLPTAAVVASTSAVPLARLARHLTSLQYFLLGQGRCRHRGMAPEQHSAATSLSRCADACAELSPDPTAGACTGFAFNERAVPFCLVYRSIPVSSHAHPDVNEWTCYAVSNSSQASESQPTTSTSAATSLPQHTASAAASKLAAGMGAPVLSLHELSGRGLLAVRRRLAPVQPDCYKPFDWISIKGGLQAALLLNQTSWNMLAKRLPVVPKKTVAIDSTVVADHVCVEVGHGGGCGQGSETPEEQVTGSMENSWWDYLLVVLFSLVMSILCTVLLARQCCGASFSRGDRLNFKTNSPREEEQAVR
eukprot:CAMPEP_0172667116 /NCGR_PEP_ID=MMETSP1074-20121228/8220_1 /TAXON_ID=2916 /ORGANISM="Ceratium fusus, Strain PA161109" /LENGTH=455 /DNA_ID=CAMNT_0013483581 /DNA_START=200 /DNA_END=1567 /DNA_ORIENTATION=+